jgi:hypothetical protein
MANVDFPMGFKPVMSLTGGPPVIMPGDRYSDGSAAIGEGDPLKKDGSGRWLSITAAGDNPDAVAANYIASGDTTTLLQMYSLRETIFEVQSDDATLADDTQIGNYFDITVNTPDTTRLRSTMELDGDASAEDTLILIGKAERPGNAWGANVNVLVKFRVDADADVIATT